MEFVVPSSEASGVFKGRAVKRGKVNPFGEWAITSSEFKRNPSMECIIFELAAYQVARWH